MTKTEVRDQPRADGRRQNTRERILRASLELFLERGFDGTTISDIERAVGLAAGTGSFYRHFRSKDDVFVAAVQRSATEYIEEFLEMLQELDRIDDPVERLRRDFHMRLAAIQKFDPIVRLMTGRARTVPRAREDVHHRLGARPVEARVGGAPASRDRDGGARRLRAALTVAGQSVPRPPGGRRSSTRWSISSPVRRSPRRSGSTERALVGRDARRLLSACAVGQEHLCRRAGRDDDGEAERLRLRCATTIRCDRTASRAPLPPTSGHRPAAARSGSARTPDGRRAAARPRRTGAGRR